MAKGKGALKAVPATKWQRTLPYHVLEEKVERAEVAGEADIIQQHVGEEEELVRTEATEEADTMQQNMEEEDELVRSEGTEEADIIIQQQSEEGELEVSEDEEIVEIVDDDSNAEELSPDHPFFVGLRQHLTSRHGKGRSQKEANAIVSAVSKYLSFAGSTLKPANLYSPHHLDRYLRSLERQGQKPSTQHALLCRLKQALEYMDLSLDSTESLKAAKCIKVLTNWMSTLGKEARKMKRIHLEDMSEETGQQSMSEIERFCHNEVMQSTLQKALKKKKKGEAISQHSLRQIMIWLAGSLLHCNAQPPGAITNATLAEYKAATLSTVGRATYKTLLVANHKTATTGRAKITASHHLAGNIDKFVACLRPQIEGSSSILLFPNRKGKPLDHLSRHVNNLANKLGIQIPSNATATRHITATAVASSSFTERSAVATAMSHSTATQNLYYAANKGKKDAVKGFSIMEGMRQTESEGTSSSRVPFSDTEKEVISNYFSQHISSGTVPSAEECRHFLYEHQLNRTQKQIRDKVRNLIGR